jgi:hypothetical protein
MSPCTYAPRTVVSCRKPCHRWGSGPGSSPSSPAASSCRSGMRSPSPARARTPRMALGGKRPGRHACRTPDRGRTARRMRTPHPCLKEYSQARHTALQGGHGPGWHCRTQRCGHLAAAASSSAPLGEAVETGLEQGSPQECGVRKRSLGGSRRRPQKQR